MLCTTQNQEMAKVRSCVAVDGKYSNLYMFKSTVHPRQRKRSCAAGEQEQSQVAVWLLPNSKSSDTQL
jgi:hypothetical protein